MSKAGELSEDKCWRCRGDGSFWVCPTGMNPFAAGGWNAARAMRKVDPCYECQGTGRAALGFAVGRLGSNRNRSAAALRAKASMDQHTTEQSSTPIGHQK